MHINSKNSWIKHFDFILISLISNVFAFWIAYYIRFGKWMTVEQSSWKMLGVFMCLVNLALTIMLNPYSGIFRRPYYIDWVKMAVLTMSCFATVSVFFYLMKFGDNYSRITLIVTYFLFYVISVAIMFVHKKLMLKGNTKTVINREKKLFLVTDFDGVDNTIENVLASDFSEYKICGLCFFGRDYLGDEYKGYKIVKKENLVKYVLGNHIDDMFVTGNPYLITQDIYQRIIKNGVAVHLDIESVVGSSVENQTISRIGVYSTASIVPYDFDLKKIVYLALKRFCDVIIGIIGCVLLVPIFLLIKLMNLLTGDTSPVIYTQDRIGLNGSRFKLYKFRSMVPNADDVLKELLKQDKYKEQWERNQKLDDDPRITKIGKFIRKTSLDEFPQFINILKGDMSLIGPRPLVDGELELHKGLTLYNKVKPGVTGWWACNGRSNINYKERLELEYFYVRNCSFGLDILIILRTIKAIIIRDGAQ